MMLRDFYFYWNVGIVAKNMRVMMKLLVKFFNFRNVSDH